MFVWRPICQTSSVYVREAAALPFYKLLFPAVCRRCSAQKPAFERWNGSRVLDCTIPLTYTGSWNVIFTNDIQSLGPASSMMVEVFLFTITTASTIQFPLLLISKNKTVCKVFSS